MKRSEALSIIFNNLQTGYKNDELAEIILIELEQAGMLPPKASFLTEYYNTVLYYEDRNEWEPEDE